MEPAGSMHYVQGPGGHIGVRGVKLKRKKMETKGVALLPHPSFYRSLPRGGTLRGTSKGRGRKNKNLWFIYFIPPFCLCFPFYALPLCYASPKVYILYSPLLRGTSSLQ